MRASLASGASFDNELVVMLDNRAERMACWLIRLDCSDGMLPVAESSKL